jgi:hypothetical protein
MGVRGLFFGAACFATLALVGCTTKSPTIARIEGSEPQRLSFGDPKSVQKIFIAKMDSCWFSQSGGILAGYKYESAPAIVDSGNGKAQMEQIIIRGAERSDGVFIVQFNAFNENTLISTRSQGFPPKLAAQMKIDVETWIVERVGCAASETIVSQAAPQASAAPPPRKSWWQ